MVGLLVGMVRFIWEYSYPNQPCGEGQNSDKPDIIAKVHYLHFGIILWFISTVVTVIVSLLTPPIPDVHLERLTFWNRFSTRRRVDLSADEDAQPDKPFQEEEDYDSLPCWRRAGAWVCGIEKMQKPLSPEEKLALEAKQTSIHEETKWRRFLNVNAVLVM